jgi:hypothetical protein
MITSLINGAAKIRCAAGPRSVGKRKGLFLTNYLYQILMVTPSPLI